MPSQLFADQPAFTDEFRLDECSFKSSGRNPYFILEPGYQLILEGEERSNFVRLEITVLDETATIAGVNTRVVTEVEYVDNQLVEISRNFFALCEPGNSIFYFGEEVDTYQDGEIVGHQGSWKAGENGARPGLMMPGNAQLEAKYFQEIAPGVALDRAEIVSLTEVVVTPAGVFVEALKTEETTPLEPEAREFKFYAPGIGLIQDSSLKLVEFSNAWSSTPVSPTAETVSLTVPKGIVLQVALDREVRIRKVGQPIHGLLVEALYAFDQEVVPVGSEVLGRITEIQGPSRKRRVWAALNMNFTPVRKVQVEFDEMVLPDGKRLPIKTAVTPGSGRTLQLVTSIDSEKKRTAKDAASDKMKEAIREAKRKWEATMKQVKEPGKAHRLKRFGLAQLPARPQYLDAGTVYFAELQEPLDFGRKPLPPPLLAAGDPAPLPCRLLAHAQLLTPLNSATTPPEAPVEAILVQPLFADDGRLLLPQGTRVNGSVVEARPARRFGRSGKLRIAFRELIPLGGMEQTVAAANLEGVQSGAEENVRLDVEGEARSTAPKRRYLSTGIAVALAVAAHKDSDVEDGVSSGGTDASEGIAGGAAGFRLPGMVVGALVPAQPLALGMGIYGASRTAYSSFVARGREVVFPKGTAMEIGFALRGNCEESAKAE
ncbi:MAG: hypothetical protein A3D93_01845 [Acidobacteria bacterium RIFCSPHIGHO2_12_FULL_67_30]|nr:MAG: hypothetical protein A2620_00920 [Acidobacteria bacterium RIFCSPHIGHO2_01_FULL_67_28]OFV89628.1 MAG: hypothetical protein A3D93_01845 [Acidobacteria bacterium RIFCSPHIGHO2_12_FULL_67_30]